MRVEAKSVDEYFAAAGEREPDLRQLDELIRGSAPSLTRVLFGGMTGKMIGYGMFHYKYASGKEGDWPIISLANQKNYMSLYICALENGQYVAESHADELGKVSVGKSCVRFKNASDVNLEALSTILSNLELRHARGEVIYGV